MILDKEVEIKVHNKTINYWKELGYEFNEPGDTIKVLPKHLKPNSKVKINCLCDNCNNKTYISYMSYNNSMNNGNGKYFCNKCGILKSRDTMFIKHGVENPSNVKYVVDKRQKTFDEKWNGHPMTSELVREKIKKTNLEKYGEECVFRNEDIKEKIRVTNLEKYGHENVSGNVDIKEKKKLTLDKNFPDKSIITKKTQETNLKKYGFNSPLKCDTVKEKSKKTNLEKYGVEYALSSSEIREKIKNTNLEKYGVDNYFKLSELIKEKSKINDIIRYQTTIDNIWHKEYSVYNKTVSGVLTMMYIKHNICNSDFQINYKMFYERMKLNSVICLKCNPKNTNSLVSSLELELFNFIKSKYSGEIINSDRNILKGKELDIYLPDLNLAFEFNGLYWHSEAEKENNYHLNKTNDCLNNNIHLIHIYEDEWQYKQEIVKSRIINLLGISNKIFARKCQIKLVDSKTEKNFLMNNHIQGNVNSKIKIGLYHDNELVSLMTFGSLRKITNQKSKDDVYEMLRFCNKLNTNVVGGASKLFKYFVEHYKPQQVLSYADRSWSRGQLYEKLNFKFISNTPPNYHYVINGIREYRFKFRKDILIKEGYDENLTEHQIMISRGIHRIYNSGSKKYIWTK